MANCYFGNRIRCLGCSEFDFVNQLRFFGLLTASSVLPHTRFRHRFGVGYPAPLHQENPLTFFNLLPSFQVEHPTMAALQ
jgi:hypothetical protein